MQDKYDYKEAEPRIAKFWNDEKIYRFDINSKKRVFAIDTPPPTVSGLIHIGHLYSYSQADFFARYKRMRGFDVFYPFGFDNNGLATELMIEKQHNTTAEKIGREKFVKLVEKEVAKYLDLYRDTYTRIGLSVDWSLRYDTVSKSSQRLSQYSFLELTKMGRTYRKEAPTIWCPKDKTALSQMELEDKVLKSKFVTLKFSDDVVIATTRPEMLPACVAILVNPEDKKNAKLVGKKVKVPIFGQEVKVISDRRVDPEKGTGVVMCCTFGDLTDIEWYRAYNLPLKIIIDERGRMLDDYFKGLSIKDAREKITKDLKEKGYLIAEKEIEHTVNVHERCKTEIEFLVKKQWYIKYLDLKEVLIEQGRKLKWHPEHMRAIYENWVNGLQWDWSISRQRYFGVPFPVWYCKKCDEPLYADEKDLPVDPLVRTPKAKCSKCGSNEFVPETDIMDTWATSSLTPLINSKWKTDEKYFERIYPMSLRPQAYDIISFWLFTTVVKSYLHTKKLPWSDALISGQGLDPQGRPMHKSAGNVIEAQPAMEKYSSDGMRYWASLSTLGENSSFQEKDAFTAQKIVNKLWNLAKFISKCKKESKKTSNVMDKWITAKCMLAVKESTDHMESYNYGAAVRTIESLFWNFADNYIEFIKYRLYNNDNTMYDALNSTYLTMLKMLAPFLPYITEEIYQNMYKQAEKGKSIHLLEWPKADEKVIDKKALEQGDIICNIITTVRRWKHDNKMALNAEISELVVDGKLESGEEDIKGAMNIKKISKGKGDIEVADTTLKIRIIR